MPSSHAGLPNELGSFQSEHGDQQPNADAACEQAACGAAPACQALPAGDAALLGPLDQPCAQGVFSGQGSVYAQPRAWDDQWQAGDDGAGSPGLLAPCLAAGSGFGDGQGTVEGMEAKQLGTDKGIAGLPAMHAVTAHNDSSSNPVAVAAHLAAAAGSVEHIIQLSETASNACACARSIDTLAQQHAPDASSVTCGLADACDSEGIAPYAISTVDAAGAGPLKSSASSCIRPACMRVGCLLNTSTNACKETEC